MESEKQSFVFVAFIKPLINEPEPLLYAKFYGIDSSKVSKLI